MLTSALEIAMAVRILSPTALTLIALFPQFSAELGRVVTTLGPSLLQILAIRFQARSPSPWRLLWKFIGAKKTSNSFS